MQQYRFCNGEVCNFSQSFCGKQVECWISAKRGSKTLIFRIAIRLINLWGRNHNCTTFDWWSAGPPLGGASNFFGTEPLAEIGGWDPFNVTEDADLGIRLSKLGFRVGSLDSTTFENANCDRKNWIRRCSRWMKG
ncbi:MAG: glycosyltransferase, partial [Marinicaulis sp.]|nr:glycosyltransferase [Marinicaulis sp.]